MMTIKSLLEAAEALARAKTGGVGRMTPQEIGTVARGLELAGISANGRTVDQIAELSAIEEKTGFCFADALRFL